MPVTLEDVAVSPTLNAVLGIPSTPGPHPAVVVVHEAFGITREMREQVEHLASLGYVALMPDLYTAGGFVRCIGATVKALQSGRGRAWDDIEASRRWLGERDDTTGATGIIGFCMGGGFALLAAVDGPYAAAAVNYGLLPKDLDEIEGSCPVVASYGDKDKTVRDGAARLTAAFEKHGVTHDVKEYPGVGHAFMNARETGPGILHPLTRIMGIRPDPAAAVDAWERITAFFDANGLARR